MSEDKNRNAVPRTNRHSRSIQAADFGPAARQMGSRPLKILMAAIAVILVGVCGAGYSVLGNLNKDLAQAGGLDLGQQTDGAMDILLTGIDSRTDAHGNKLSQEEIDMLQAGEEEVTNTDTMILIRVPSDGSSATAVSLPRDTYVRTPSMGNMKLNGVYGAVKQEHMDKLLEAGVTDEAAIERESSEAGRKELISTVADLTGINVDHYAEVGLLGFVLLTDAVGGVDVCLNNPVNEPLSGANFPAGEQTLSGAQALSFVRQRHDLPRGDLDRITRQQAYMASLVNKILSTGTLTNPATLGRLNDAVQRSVVLDEGWDVIGLAEQMQSLSGGNVSFQTIPVTSIDGVGDFGESIVTVDKTQVHDFFDNLLGDEKEEEAAPEVENDGKFEASDYEVSVKNASQISGLAARTAKLITDYGYLEGEVGNLEDSGVSQSQVNAKDANDPAALALAKQLGGLQVVEDPSLPEKKLSVTLAGTYEGPGILEDSAPLLAPDDPLVGTLTEGILDKDGDGTPDDGGTIPESSDASEDDKVVGQEGSREKTEISPPIDAGGEGPMCVN